MVNEVCIDLLNSTKELECTAWRCVQCGDIIDAVILRNRQLRQASTPLFSSLILASSAEPPVAV